MGLSFAFSPALESVYMVKLFFLPTVSTSICNVWIKGRFRVFLHVITWDFCDAVDTFTQHHADKNHGSALSLGNLTAARPIYLTFGILCQERSTAGD